MSNDCPKVLFLTHSGQLGGAELSLTDLVRPYSATSTCVLLQKGPFGDYLQSSTKIDVQQLCYDLRHIKQKSRIGTIVAAGFYALNISTRLAVSAKSFDLIYANTLKAGMIGMLTGILCSRPVIIHLRDILSPEHVNRTNSAIFTSFSNKLAAAVVCNSQATARAYIAAGGSAKNLHVIYPGFVHSKYQAVEDRETAKTRHELGIPKEALVVGCFSRLSRWKGQDVLLRAIVEQSPPVVLLLVGAALFGEDEFVEELKSLAEELGVAERTIFAGFRDNVEKLLPLCDIVVHPSRSPEPFGRAVVEAQLSGKLVIGSDNGGIQEIIEHGKTGLLVPPGDWEALSETLAMALADASLRNDIGTRSRESAATKFSMTAMNEATRKVIGEVLASVAHTAMP